MPKLIFLLLLFPSICFGADYYVDATGGGDANDGLTTGTAWQNISRVNGNFSAGDTVLFNRGGVWSGNFINITVAGIPNGKITFDAYGSGGNPLIYGFTNITSDWDKYVATDIYSTTVTEDNRPTVVVEDDSTRLLYIYWDADIATTSVDMYAGSYTYDNTTKLLYVWTSDSSNASTKTISYEDLEYGFYALKPNTHFNHTTISNFSFTGVKRPVQYGDYDSIDWCHNLLLQNCTFEFCGSNIRVEGDNNQALNNYFINCGGANLTVWNDGQVPALMYGHGNNITIKNNTVINQQGSCFELNWNVTNSTLSNNYGNNCKRQFVEVWDLSNHNVVENNYCEDMGAVAIKLAYGSHNNTVRNNIIIGYAADTTAGAGITVSYDDSLKYGKDNLIYHNTIYSNYTSTTSGIYTATGHSNNTIKNNIVSTVNELCMFDSDGTNTWDNNIYYRSPGTGSLNITKWIGTEYNITSFANYQSASKNDTNSQVSDPDLINTYLLFSASPAINNGTDVGITVDYRGIPRPQGGGYDIGAIEFFRGVQIRGNITLNNVTVN